MYVSSGNIGNSALALFAFYFAAVCVVYISFCALWNCWRVRQFFHALLYLHTRIV